MIRNIESKKIITLFLALLMLFSLIAPVSVSAADEYWKVCTVTNQIGMFEDVIEKTREGLDVPSGTPVPGVVIQDKGEWKQILQFDSTNKVLSINKTNWESLGSKNRDEALKRFIDELNNSDMDDAVKNSIMDKFEEVNDTVTATMFPIILQATKANIFRAYKIAKPFLDILNIALGIGAILLILLLLFSTVMDMVYIGLPVWREAQNDKGSGKNPIGVSYEAIKTVQEIEKGLGGGDGEYRNAYLLYFRRRALTYIILAICLFYLICGGLSGIIGFILHLVSGITGA